MRPHLCSVPILAALAAAAPAQRENMSPLEVVWVGSPIIEDCSEPTEGDLLWHQTGYDDTGWEPITLPEVNNLPFPGSRCYRGLFEVPEGAICNLVWTSDDGSWVYLNGEPLGHWGGDCHEGGCVGGVGGCGGPGGYLDLTDHIVEGVNLLAVRVSNSHHCCGSLFDAQVATDGLTPMAASMATGAGRPPSAPEVRTGLEVTITDPSVDPDGDPVFYLFHWTSSGGDSVIHGPFRRTSDTLTEHHLVDPGETWSVAVYPTDGVTTGPVARARFEIAHRGGVHDVNDDGAVNAADLTTLIDVLTGDTD